MQDNSKDFYKILGVTENATNEQIKQAFHNLAFKYHPDRPGGDEKRFKEINEAYQTLSNQESRRQYDTMRKFGTSNNFNQGSGFNWTDVNFGNVSDFSSFSDINDIFGSFFNSSFKNENQKKSNVNKDIEITINISFKESFLNTKKEIRYTRSNICEACKGFGYPSDAKLHTCKTCKGKGYVEHKRHVPFFGTINEKVECIECNGLGEIPDKKCKVCNSTGYVKETKIENISIPAGIRNGDVLELKNYGEFKNKKYKAGNLYIRVLVKDDKDFWRENDNLCFNLNINFAEAALGTKKEIKNIDDKILIIDIPKGIENNTVLKIKGKGFKKLNQNIYSDLLISVKINTPKKLSKNAEELFRKLKQEL